jgi:hypothetical protein
MEDLITCTGIQCTYNTYDTMECTKDCHETTPSGDCKYYTRVFQVSNLKLSDDQARDYIKQLRR